jgi:phosphocarrier protein FPr
MVGIVIVSHSEKLAAAVRELTRQMVGSAVEIAIAAGIDDPENPFGTDPMRVLAAIEAADRGEGVLLLMDLGSAVMSAEMALEFLEADRRSRVRLCEAPLVEGAIAAAVAVSTGADLDRAIAEARSALTPKASQLGIETASRPAPNATTGEPTSQLRLTIRNRLGIHARPAALFVQVASQFTASIAVTHLRRSSEAIDGKSIIQLMTLGVRQGDEIAIAARGIDSGNAVQALKELIQCNFHEGDADAPEAATSVPTVPTGEGVQGIAASPGVALGPLVRYHPVLPEVREGMAEDPESEWDTLQLAVQNARRQMQMLANAMSSPETGAIFEAHQLYLQDPYLWKGIRHDIFVEKYGAIAAWKRAIDETVRRYQNLDDPYLQARSSDLNDIGIRVLRALSGNSSVRLELRDPGILLTGDLTPSEVAQLDPKVILGICTTGGSANSHSAILARNLGIPTVMGLGDRLAGVADGTEIALDGDTGEVWVEPDRDRRRTLAAKRQVSEPRAIAPSPTQTRDGRRVTLLANVMGIPDAQLARNSGAEGVGLLRTEFFYFDRPIPPGEEEQAQVYRAIADIFKNRPTVIRTLDVGGDKPLPWLQLPPENNPFLGLRGIRLLLDRPDLFKTQLRAILKASHGRQIKVMFPTVATLAEWRAAKALLDRAKAELDGEDRVYNRAIAVGMMVEIPAAVAIVDRFAAEVDFFSIGTNDLTQYYLAADRTNPQVSPFANVLEPSVLRAIAQTTRAAGAVGVPVAVCGELASNPAAVPLLVGLGIAELSLNPRAIAAVKAAIARFSVPEAEAIAATALQLDSAEAVRNFLQQQFSALS